MSFSPWLEFIVVLSGSVIGAYLAVRVTLARMEGQIKAQGVRIEDHAKRIDRLEGVYFKSD